MGEEGIFRLLEDFYRQLELSDIRSLFGDDLMESSRRAAAFYVQLLGGPALYNTRYGNPMMRKRHLPFLIDEAAREIWLSCFLETLENPTEYGFPAEHVESFRRWLDGFSHWMVNTRSTQS